MAHAHRHEHGPGHRHGVMTGLVVAPYDAVIAGLLLRGAYRDLAGLLAERTPADGTVVDVGTGPGRLPARLTVLRPDLTVIGIDPSPDMLARARRRNAGSARVRFEQAGAEALPMAAGSVQAVVSSLSAHHWADRDVALAEQARVLAPGGRWYLLDLRREVSTELTAAIDRAGLSLATEASPLRRGRRWFTFLTATLAATRPTT